MKMEPISWILLCLGLAAGLGAGFGAGRITAPKEDNSTPVTEAVAANTEAMKGLTEAASRPLTLDAETRAGLASDIPAGCAEKAASLTPACLVAQCWRFGQSAAQRPEGCGDLLRDARIQSWLTICGVDANGKPDWKCVLAAQDAARR
jgi:hypothetical protein